MAGNTRFAVSAGKWHKVRVTACLKVSGVPCCQNTALSSSDRVLPDSRLFRGSIVGSGDQMVLHRPVEPAGLIRMRENRLYLEFDRNPRIKIESFALTSKSPGALKASSIGLIHSLGSCPLGRDDGGGLGCASVGSVFLLLHVAVDRRDHRLWLPFHSRQESLPSRSATPTPPILPRCRILLLGRLLHSSILPGAHRKRSRASSKLIGDWSKPPRGQRRSTSTRSPSPASRGS